MVLSRGLRVALLLSIVALVVLAAPSVAKVSRDSYLLENVYTQEATTTNREVTLKGDRVLEAWFNFTVRDDFLDSEPDSFIFTVHNKDDPSLTKSMPGTTDTEGRLSIHLPFTLEASPGWTVSVSCTQAGDVMIGQWVREEDPGNPWSLQVEYAYSVDDDGNGGNGGNGGDGGDSQPMLVTLFEANLVVIALLSLLVAFLALNVLRGEGSLRLPFILALILLVDALFSLPVALLVNLELNDTIIGMPPYGPHWLGNMAVMLVVLWSVPFMLARKRVIASNDLHMLLSRVTSEGLAERVRTRGRGHADDPLSDRMLALVMMVIGIASVAVVAMILLG